MQAYEIPVTSRPQNFNINFNGTPYTIRQYWLKPAQCWVFDIKDRTGNNLICGIPLVTGANLIGQFKYILRERLFVISDHTGPTDLPDQVPDWTHLGITGHVYYNPPE